MTAIKKQITIILLLCSAAALYPLGDMEKTQSPADPAATTGAEVITGHSGTVILPESFLRSFDPVTVFFNTDYGPAGGGPLDNPGRIISITPPHPGEYRWLDARTLQFLPAIPWAPLARYEITAGHTAKTLVTLMIPPEKLTPPAGKTDLEPFSELRLEFSGYIDPARLKEMLSFEIKPLPGLSGQEAYWLNAGDFTLQELDRQSAADNYIYRLRLSHPPDYGSQITLHIRLAPDSSADGSVAAYTYRTKPRFTLRGMGCGSVNYPVAAKGSVYTVDQAVNCGRGSTPLFVEFSENLAELSVTALKKLVQFQPAVRNLSHRISGSRLYLSCEVDKETPYRLSLHYTPIAGSSGRVLAEFGDTSFFFYYTQLSPYLAWSQGKGIIERYGPQFFPMEGRAMEKVDLRIYRIDPLNRNFWPFPEKALSVNEESRPPMPGEEPDYGTRMAEQIRLLGTPLLSRIINLPLSDTSPGSRFGMDLKPLFAEITGPGRPGTYLVGYRIPGPAENRMYSRVTVTDLSLSVVEEEHVVNFFVTSLNDGSPVAGAGIALDADVAGQWQSVITGITDDAGRFYYEHTQSLQQLADLSSSLKRITVTNGSDVLVLDTAEPPPHFMNNHWFRSSGSWLNWLSSQPYRESEAAVRKGFLITERPIYRPAEPVHFYGCIRIRQQGQILAAEAGRQHLLTISGPGYKSWSYPLQQEGLGHFHYLFDEADLPTGKYTACLLDTESNETLASVTFKKEAYRIPRFEINITGPDKVPLDQVFQLVLTADYYAGGRVTAQEVTWEITQYPHEVRPPRFPGYIFSSDERFNDGGGYDYYGTSIQRDLTDENGSATLSLNPAAEEDSLPRRYVVEATLRGADAQTVTTSRSVYALPPFIIGLKTPGFIKEEQVIRPSIIAIGYDESPAAGQLLKVRLYQRQWHSYLSESDFTTGQTRYTSDVVDNLLLEKEYTTTDKPLEPVFPVSESGVYVVEVLGWDNLGRLQRVFTDLYVAGDDPVTWQKTQANVFETALDRSSYAPGDTATLLLKSPFQEARALVIIEAPRGNSYHWTDITGGQGLFSFHIEKEMTPAVPVHALLLRGRIEGTGKQVSFREDRGKPVAMANTTWVKVEPAENQVMVELEHPARQLPGSRMPLTIKLSDNRGNPLDGEVALWLVDRAVLALDREQFANPLDSFLDPAATQLRIRETRNEIVGNLIVEEIPGGGGDDEYDIEKSQSLIERTTVRRNFRTVAYYNDKIRVKDGRVQLNIDLPENLTEFAIRAVALSGYDRFGIARSTVAIRLPLIVQAALPRFVRPGDAFTAGGIARVVEGEGGSGSVEIQTSGLRIQEQEQRVTKAAAGITLEQNRPLRLYYPFRVPGPLEGLAQQEIAITMAVARDYDGVSDGFEIKLPVRYEAEKRRLDSYTELAGIAEPAAGQLAFPELPAQYMPGSLKRTVLITGEPAAVRMLNGLNFLADYRHGCTEQRISRALPAVALAGIIAAGGFDRQLQYTAADFANLTTYLDTTLHGSGLYSFWPGSTPYVSLTAYVVEFLCLARKAGFTFDEKLLSRPVIALREALRSDYPGFIAGAAFRERIEALAALAAAGEFDTAYAFDLLAGALQSDLYSRGKILELFLQQGRDTHEGVKTLQNSLWSSTVFKLDAGGREVFGGFQNANQNQGGLILASPTRTLAMVTRALYRAQPQNLRVRILADEMVSRADTSGWGNTSDNAACLLTLGELLKQTSGGSGYQFELQTGNKTVLIDTAGRSLYTYTDKAAGGFLRFKSGDPENLPAVYRLVEYLPALELDKETQQNEGFVVTREHHEYNAANRLLARHPVQAGSHADYALDTIVEEHVQVINAGQHNFVAICVPFAAGFELLNPELATSPPEAAPKGRLTLQPSYSLYADDQVIFYYDSLPAGTYDFYFRLKAAFAGSFIQPPARAELMYDPKTRGQSEGTRINLSEAENTVK